MAHLFRKTADGNYSVKFRFQGRCFKRSLKTNDDGEAEEKLLGVKRILKRLVAGREQIPAGVEPGAYIASEGEIRMPAAPSPDQPSLVKVVEVYLTSQKDRCSEGYLSSQRTHLRHVCGFLGQKAERPCDEITSNDLENFIEARLAIRDRNTVIRERNTLLQYWRWLRAKGYLQNNPAEKLETIKGGRDLPPFRTTPEIEKIIERGGLDENGVRELWRCLYLTIDEIGALLKLVHEKAPRSIQFLLHAIPAYTGMRRGEMLRLTWLDVDLDGGFITVRSRKQSRSRSETRRTIELHPELRVHLLAWQNHQKAGQYVLCKPGTPEPVDIHLSNRLFRQPLRHSTWCLDEKKGVFKIGFHTYRHSFASNLAALGVDQRVINEILGHTTEQMARRYRHLFPNTRRAAIEAFSLQGKSPATSA